MFIARRWLSVMLSQLDLNSLLSGAVGVISALAAIKARLAVAEYKLNELRKRFDAHEKKATH